MIGFRRQKKETLSLEVDIGIDGQGMPLFDSPVDIEGRVLRTTDVERTGTGSKVRVMAVVWIDGTESPLPDEDDRITLADGTMGIVVERIDRKTPRDPTTVSIVRCQLREWADHDGR